MGEAGTGAAANQAGWVWPRLRRSLRHRRATPSTGLPSLTVATTAAAWRGVGSRPGFWRRYTSTIDMVASA
jgi:hypothetical protein